MKFLVFILTVGLLIGRNLPFDGIFFFGLGLFDLVAFIFGVFLFSRYKYIFDRSIVYALLCFFIFSLIGLSINYNRGLFFNDLFELLRIFYFILLVYVGYEIKKYLNYKKFVFCLFLASIIIFVFAYLNPMNPDVLGFVQIWNPNVVGLSIIHFIVLIILFSSNIKYSSIIILILLSFSFFTYSKAIWLLISLILLYLFWFSNFSVKLFLFSLILFIIYINFDFFNSFLILIDSKIIATGFDKTAAEGSSSGARFGLALSGFKMFLENPFFGVGIGNFEIENLKNQSSLGLDFYLDDNANSLIFHYLGTTGLFGLIPILFIFFIYFKRLSFLSNRFSFDIIILFFIFISINFQRELFTTNVIWLVLGYTYEENSVNQSRN